MVVSGTGNERRVHEIRWNPLIRQWIIVAGHRKKRPWRPGERKGEKPFCPFCPGAPETKDLGAWDVIVLPNRYPALSPEAPMVSSRDGLYRVMRALGVCEVVVETPDHEGDLCDLGLEHMKRVVKVFAKEYGRLGKLDYVKYVAEFRNKGKEIGVSLTHPHSQIYALPFIPPRIMAELESFKEYYRRENKCLLCEIIERERGERTRLIYENKFFTVLLPYFAMWPYEIHVYPRRHIQALTDLSDEEALYLADALRVVTATYNNLFDRDLPYIMAIHQKPVDGRDYSFYHMHIEFYQPYRERDKLKYAAGIEWGYWTFTYDGVPEEKAMELRKACSKALEKLDKYLGSIPG
ncbi:MAG: galactose-1-phosphate uridylyltransferase [Desulfurococcales archaeon]|nr:galactose-1-phosphate uridylyltransferase [Desulfurococcales archaeon]